jgi:predicted transposase YdaD
LEGLNVTRSPFLESIRAEGRKEGIKEGIKEGRAEDRAEALVQLLQAKFPGQTPAEVLRRVEQSRDLDLLRRWFAAALTAATLDEFLQRTSLAP